MPRREHCEFPDCLMFARVGERFCSEHRDTPVPDDMPEDVTYVEWVTQREAERKARKRAEFFARLDAGDYAKLYTPEIARLIDEAAKIKGVETERGALRVVMAEVVETVSDVGDKARLVATLARSSAQLERADKALPGEVIGGLAELLMGVLGDLDGES